MRLSNLIASNEGLTLRGGDTDIAGIATDSREVKPGYLFVAIPGTKQDGRAYIDEAVNRGAAAVLTTGDGQQAINNLSSVLCASSLDIRKAVSQIAAAYYPRQPEIIAAVTGTSGKTSTAQFAREIWQKLGHNSASIGTLGLVTAKETRYGSLTTPDAVELHKLLQETAESGVTHLATEASSHGLFLHRLDNVNVKIGGFTNLSRDHLDFHKSMEDYFAAKLRLFTHVMEPGGTAVVNADAAEFAEIAAAAKTRRHKIISYGRHGKEICLKSVTPHARGQVLQFDLFGRSCEILLPVIGGFQAWNSLCALGMVVAGGEDDTRAVDALSQVTGVPGRLQMVGQTPQGGAVFVDYAHKPDALENVLKAMRPHVAAHPGAKLGVVFGCGGNRDAGKRPIMGKIAQRLADWTIVTDDNPRNEDRATIRAAVMSGIKTKTNVQEIGDRAKAIAAGIEKLGPNDVLVIAGKGHESGQIVGDQVLPFDDAEVARKVLGWQNGS